MPIDYKKIAEENIKKYGTDIDRYGPVLLANLYSDRTHFIYELLQNAEDACDRARKAGVRNEFYVKFKLFPDRLEMRHDGIIFNENDVRGICGLVEGTKEKDFTQIGTFGIGFKSVYAYTSKPRIYSGDEAFCVENYVQPSGRKKVNIKDNETLFIFPFDHRKVSPDQAFKDISKRLRELGSRTLLFLNNIGEINWKIVGEESGAYIRDAKFISEYSKKIYIISKAGEQEDKGEEWLVFERIIQPESTNVANLKVEVAFRIDRTKKDKRETIIPADNSHLVVFFPTEKETHLKFLIQGPYKTTPARDNIPKKDEWNKNLIKQTAALVADSIPTIKEMGFLTVGFLNLLPISEDNFPEDHMFRPIYNAVLEKLKSGEKLLPANNGSYISAKQAFLAGGRDLIDLLGTEQLSLLFGKQNACWLDSNITQDKTPELREHFIDKLDITEITRKKVSRDFTEEFIKRQCDEWIIKFYTFLKERKPLWRKGSNTYWDREGPLRSKPFIRLEGNIHVAPFDDSGKPQAYLPTLTDSSFPTVKRKIAEDVQAREFLKNLRLKEPDKIAEVIEFILPKYQKDDVKVSEKDNLEDVRKMLEVLDNNSESKKSDLFERLKSVSFLLAHNVTDDELLYKKPSEIYLPEAITGNSDTETYFKGYDKAYFLSYKYKKLDNQEKLHQFFLALGLKDKPRKIKIEPQLSREEKRGLRGNDGCTYERESKDYDIEGLDYFLKNNITVANAVILWGFLLNHIKGLERWAFNSFFHGKYCWFYYSEKSTVFDAKFLKTLRYYNWLPGKNGNLHKPPEILLSELPDDFEKESLEAKSLAEKLEFKKDIEQELLSKLPSEKRKIYELVNSSSEEDIQAIKQLLKERKRKSQFPEGKAPNKTRREKKAKENYVSSKKKKSEKKERLVRITQDQIDKRTSLREWYQDNEEKVVCQICKSPSHFKNRQGKYYFEAIEMVKDEKEYDANALALCPSCAAKYLYGEKTERAEIKQKLIKLYNDLNNGSLDQNELKITISLCGKMADIQFVEKHLIDLSPIFVKNEYS